jgi:hypothetical protein
VAQVHNYPGTDVTMSDLDVKWAVADFPGALSIIVPSYSREGLDLFNANVYEKNETSSSPLMMNPEEEGNWLIPQALPSV